MNERSALIGTSGSRRSRPERVANILCLGENTPFLDSRGSMHNALEEKTQSRRREPGGWSILHYAQPIRWKDCQRGLQSHDRGAKSPGLILVEAVVQACLSQLEDSTSNHALSYTEVNGGRYTQPSSTSSLEGRRTNASVCGGQRPSWVGL